MCDSNKAELLNTYIINLNDSTTRMSEITAKLNAHKIQFNRIEAVDGRKSSPIDFPEYNPKRSINRHGRNLTGGEIACYLSHVKALKEFVESGKKLALILEDDASFTSDFKSQLDQICDVIHKSENWDVINLVQFRKEWQQSWKHTNENTISRAYYFPMLATANLWSRDGAISFINGKFGRTVSGPFDTELRSFCALRGRGLSLEHPISYPSGIKSDIDDSQVTRTNAKGNRKNRPIKPRIVRHFPDYVNAYINMKIKSKNLQIFLNRYFK